MKPYRKLTKPHLRRRDGRWEAVPSPLTSAERLGLAQDACMRLNYLGPGARLTLPTLKERS